MNTQATKVDWSDLEDAVDSALERIGKDTPANIINHAIEDVRQALTVLGRVARREHLNACADRENPWGVEAGKNYIVRDTDGDQFFFVVDEITDERVIGVVFHNGEELFPTRYSINAVRAILKDWKWWESSIKQHNA